MQHFNLLVPFLSAAFAQNIHVIKVGDGGLNFNPAETRAAIGDVVEFQFVSGTHSVAKGIFANPCQPFNSSSFFSGHINSESEKSQVFTIRVEDEEPIWYYCATGPHCKLGMAGVINAPSGVETLDMYKDVAADANAVIIPSKTGGGSFEQATSAASSTPPAATTSETNTPNAGAEVRGNVHWGLMSVGIAMVGYVSGLIL
ncbi:putative GPI-anchored cupredoxin [Paramyrothecium foliicola]|nr:putative GPI-anchored cupredoxin [Paramyrothecium foliicola]